MTFLERPCTHSNAFIWTTFELSGNEKWIYDGLLQTLLVMVSNGSYNKNLANNILYGSK